jgi:hypothetical protein
MKPALLVSPLAFVGARCFFFFFKLRPTRACIWDPVTGKRIQWSLNALAESGTPEATLAAIQRQVIYSLPRAGMLVGTRVCMWGTSGGVRVGGSVGASAAWLSIRITLPPSPLPPPPCPLQSTSLPINTLRRRYGRPHYSFLHRLPLPSVAIDRGEGLCVTQRFCVCACARAVHLQWSYFDFGICAYANFTSPIRRFADVVTHRSLAYVLAQESGCEAAVAASRARAAELGIVLPEEAPEAVAGQARWRLCCPPDPPSSSSLPPPPSAPGSLLCVGVSVTE